MRCDCCGKVDLFFFKKERSDEPLPKGGSVCMRSFRINHYSGFLHNAYLYRKKVSW